MFPRTHTFCCSTSHSSNQPLSDESQACCMEDCGIWASQCAGWDTLTVPRTTASAATHSTGQSSHTSTPQPTRISMKHPLAMLIFALPLWRRLKFEFVTHYVAAMVILKENASSREPPVTPGTSQKAFTWDKATPGGTIAAGLFTRTENPLRPLTTLGPSYSHL